MEEAVDAPGLDLPARATPVDMQPHLWSPLTRFGFRLAFCYFLTYCLCNGNANVWNYLPVIGGYPSRWFSTPFVQAGQFLAQHLFHVRGVGVHLHPTGSGDTAIQWIAFGVMIAWALVAALIWTALDRRRPHYQTLFAWLRFTIRLMLGIGMVTYGLVKVFPLQMPPPSLAVLNEPLGQSSPMTLLWTMLGMSPVYEAICGAAELTAGLLILFRRTALAGALLTAFVTINIVLYNFVFDVPVKLYAAHLLLLALFVILPDIPALFTFFWKHQPAAPTGVWVPPATRPGFRRATAIIEAILLISAVGTSLFYLIPGYRQVSAATRAPSPLKGIWHLDSSILTDGKAPPRPQPFVTGDGQPMAELVVDSPRRIFIRSADGVLWRGFLDIKPEKHTVMMGSIGSSKPVTYEITFPDPNHLRLVPADKAAHTDPALTFTRVPTPATYPLLTRGFHLVNEWGLER